VESTLQVTGHIDVQKNIIFVPAPSFIA
jgi:hypothetical protein